MWVAVASPSMLVWYLGSLTDWAVLRSAATLSVVKLTNRCCGSWASTHSGGLSMSLTMHSVSCTTVTFESESAESVRTRRVARNARSSTWPVLALRSFAGPVATWITSRSSGVFSARDGA